MYHMYTIVDSYADDDRQDDHIVEVDLEPYEARETEEPYHPQQHWGHRYKCVLHASQHHEKKYPCRRQNHRA